MFAENTCEIADAALCNETFALVRNHQSIGSRSDVLTFPSAKKYVQRLLQDAPQAKVPVRGRLAIVVGARKGSVGFHVAEELAVAAQMHVVLVGRSFPELGGSVRSIQDEFKRRHGEEERAPKLYQVRMNTNGYRSVIAAAEEIEIIAKLNYQGQVHVFVNLGGEVSESYSRTEEGVEGNMGRNYLAPRLLADLLLPQMRAAATDEYKPRLIQEATIGHCLGADFDPFRFQKSPRRGGASEETIASNMETDQLEYVSPTVGLEMFYRSKMALMADTMAFAKEEPMLAIVSCDPGLLYYARASASAFRKPLSSRVMDPSPSQAARSALRAALDPAFNSTEILYLHSDGNPWRMAEPTTFKCNLEDYAAIVRDTGDELSGRLVADIECEWELWSAETSSSSLLGDWSLSSSPVVSRSVSPLPLSMVAATEKKMLALSPPPFTTTVSSPSSILPVSSHILWGRSMAALATQ